LWHAQQHCQLLNYDNVTRHANLSNPAADAAVLCHGQIQMIGDSWLAIEQHKLVNIDRSLPAALSAARSAGALDVVHKLDAMIGVVPKQQQQQPQQMVPPGLAAAGFAAEMEFRPDLALKQVRVCTCTTHHCRICITPADADATAQVLLLLLLLLLRRATQSAH
jgi:hypothetical protein